jgi:hypothetical protein
VHHAIHARDRRGARSDRGPPIRAGRIPASAATSVPSAAGRRNSWEPSITDIATLFDPVVFS